MYSITRRHPQPLIHPVFDKKSKYQRFIYIFLQTSLAGKTSRFHTDIKIGERERGENYPRVEETPTHSMCAESRVWSWLIIGVLEVILDVECTMPSGFHTSDFVPSHDHKIEHLICDSTWLCQVLLEYWISKREAKTDPIKTRKAPTTSIQFLWPGKIEARTVYWGTSKRTTEVLKIMLRVEPEIDCKEHPQNTQIQTDAEQWTKTTVASFEFCGHTGDSARKVRIKLLVNPITKDQNNDLTMFSPTHGNFLKREVTKTYDTPPNPTKIMPITLLCSCGICSRNNSNILSFFPWLLIVLVFADSNQQETQSVHINCHPVVLFDVDMSALMLSQGFDVSFTPNCV